jgi:hypothetical protein
MSLRMNLVRIIMIPSSQFTAIGRPPTHSCTPCILPEFQYTSKGRCRTLPFDLTKFRIYTSNFHVIATGKRLQAQVTRQETSPDHLSQEANFIVCLMMTTHTHMSRIGVVMRSLTSRTYENMGNQCRKVVLARANLRNDIMILSFWLARLEGASVNMPVVQQLNIPE